MLPNTYMAATEMIIENNQTSPDQCFSVVSVTAPAWKGSVFESQ